MAKKSKAKKGTFDVRAAGLSVGIAWAAGVVILAFLAAKADYAQPIVELIGSGYLGYEASFQGALVGAVWALADGFIGGAVIAWLYNELSQ